MTERGKSPRWLAALGLALALVALTLPWSARALADRELASAIQPIGVPRPLSTSSSVPGPATAAPYDVAAPVELRSTRPSARSRPEPNPGVPLRVVVPSLRVDAPVVPISASGGVLLPPGDPQTLGWWQDGAQPGAATGGALITGHTVHTGGGALDDLDTMHAGQPVRVRTSTGTLQYVVSSVTVYRKATLARDAQRIFSQAVPGRLVLITCEDWNGSGYDSNAVVVANPI
jgi:LPXTG-site transpeptidase (sortase) family protein